MFRPVVLFCICSILTPYLVNAMTAEQKAKIRAHFETVGFKCIKDNAITEDDFNNLRAKKIPTGPNAPCFLACVLKDVGVMDAQGMLQKETALELAKTIFENDDDELKVIGEYLHSCAPVNSEAVGDGEKGCERALLAYKCMVENAVTFGLDV